MRIEFAGGISIEAPQDIDADVLCGSYPSCHRRVPSMMRPSNDIDVVWLARGAVDFRKGINGLSVLVEEQLAHDPFSGQLLVFVNKKRDKFKSRKILAPDGPRTGSSS